jgi:hypothetical protein
MKRSGAHVRATALLERLKGGDRRSIGRSGEVVEAVARAPELLPHLVGGLEAADEVVRMRAADALEKVTREHPEWLRPYKRRLLRVAATPDQQEVRWHVAQLLPRLPLTAAERRDAIALLDGYLEDASAIVRTCALQALADLVGDDPAASAVARRRVQKAAESSTPSLRARARQLLAHWPPAPTARSR